MVPDQIWEEDCSLHWHHGKQCVVALHLKAGVYGVLSCGLFYSCLSPQWAVPFMILIVCIESSLIVAYVVSVAAGVSVAAAFLLPW